MTKPMHLQRSFLNALRFGKGLSPRPLRVATCHHLSKIPIDDWPRRSALGCDLNGLVPANLEWMAKQLAWHLVANTPTGFAEVRLSQ